jgi:hypothetical protein
MASGVEGRGAQRTRSVGVSECRDSGVQKAGENRGVAKKLDLDVFLVSRLQKWRAPEAKNGPQLDKFDKARNEFSTLQEALKKKGTEVFAIGLSVGAALKGFEEVVKGLEATDKTIRADFKATDFDTFTDTYVRQYKDVHVSCGKTDRRRRRECRRASLGGCATAYSWRRAISGSTRKARRAGK